MIIVLRVPKPLHGQGFHRFEPQTFKVLEFSQQNLPPNPLGIIKAYGLGFRSNAHSPQDRKEQRLASIWISAVGPSWFPWHMH